LTILVKCKIIHNIYIPLPPSSITNFNSMITVNSSEDLLVLFSVSDVFAHMGQS